MPLPVFPSRPPGEPSVHFASEDVDFQLATPTVAAAWLKKIVAVEGKQLHWLSFVFCSDQHLHQINLQYLQHDTLTDIITFPYAEPPVVEGDIFISVERVKENAEKFGVLFSQELFRVMAHGVLHLCGYPDKTPAEKEIMRAKEDAALALRTQT